MKSIFKQLKHFRVLNSAANERDRLRQEFLQNRRQYEANKARGRADLDIFGRGVIRKPSTPAATPFGNGQWAAQQQMLEQKRQKANIEKERQGEGSNLQCSRLAFILSMIVMC